MKWVKDDGYIYSAKCRLLGKKIVFTVIVAANKW